jgi:hypothetical protein
MILLSLNNSGASEGGCHRRKAKRLSYRLDQDFQNRPLLNASRETLLLSRDPVSIAAEPKS